MPSPIATLTTLAALAADELSAPAEDDPPSTVWLVVGGACLLAGIIGSIAASSLLLYSQAKLQRAVGPDGERLLQNLVQHRRSYHLIARMLAITGLVVAGIITWHATSGSTRTVAAIAYAVIALIGCGVVPGLLAERRAEGVVAGSYWVLESLRTMLYFPVVVPSAAFGDLLLRSLRIRKSTPEDEDMADEILAAVEDTTGDSGLAEEERAWIENIIDLKSRQAFEVMTPRTDAVAFDKDMPLIDAVKQAAEAGFSRFPVYRESIDNIVGLFYAKDALPLIGQNGRATDPSLVVGEFTRAPLFVPETLDVVELLRQFRTSRVQMAIVLDEYGGTAGLVSLEDVLEEIVGDITDEYDADDAPIKIIEAGKIVEAAGRVRIEEINEVLLQDLPEAEDYETIAGYVFTTLHRIPQVNESVEVGGVQFEVLEGDERRIHRLRLTVSPAHSES